MDNIQTSDMYLASTLLAYGGEIDHIDSNNPQRKVFVFKSLPTQVWVTENELATKRIVSSLEEVQNLRASEKLLYPPNFVTAIKNIKSYIYTE